MPLSKIGRVHLTYQFIILAMLVMFIGYDELLSERKYVYLSIISIFLFAIVILSCYTELLPVKTWISRYYTSAECLENKEESLKKGSESSEYANKTTQEKKESERVEKTESLNKPRIYRLRNWKKDGVTENNPIKKSSSIFDASSIVPMKDIGEYNFGSYATEESDLTKRYYFPFRQKRLEEWVESKESRPYKIRPWQSNPQDNINSTTDSVEVSSTKNMDKPVLSLSPRSPEVPIAKSYSFPFRRKRLENWMEIQENQKVNLEITSSLPQWDSIDYSEYDSEFKMRRSLSGSVLNSGEVDLSKIDKEKDFSQSVEVGHVSSAVFSNAPTSPTNAFDKIKAGFKDYFSKRRKESFKSSSKRRAFKSFFQSKENISLNGSEKKVT